MLYRRGRSAEREAAWRSAQETATGQKTKATYESVEGHGSALEGTASEPKKEKRQRGS